MGNPKKTSAITAAAVALFASVTLAPAAQADITKTWLGDFRLDSPELQPGPARLVQCSGYWYPGFRDVCALGIIDPPQ